MRRFTLGIVTLALVGLWQLPLRGAPNADEESTPFTLSSSGGDTVLEITFSGGYTGLGESTAYRLYGDGRFVRTQRSGTREQKDEALLSYVEAVDFVAVLVRGNLMNWLDDDTIRRFKEELGGIPIHKDISTTRIRVSLETYGQNGPLTKEIAFSFSPSLLKLSAPHLSLPEVQALDAFMKQVKDYFTTRKVSK